MGTPQAAYKAVSRWESSTNRPTGRKLDAIAKTIEALGYYRQNGGPTRALIGREIARASSVEDWLQGFDLAKASEPPEHERVRLIGQIGDVWQYECHGPGKFWLTRDGEIQAGFCLRPGEVKSILTHEACLLASGPSCEGSNESRPNRQLQTALRSLWEREEKGDRQ